MSEEPTKVTAPSGPSRSLLLRVVYMLVFAMIFSVLCSVLAVVAISQLILRVLSGNANLELRRFGAALARYAGQIVAYLCFSSDRAPFPFRDWPNLPTTGITEDDLQDF